MQKRTKLEACFHMLYFFGTGLPDFFFGLCESVTPGQKIYHCATVQHMGDTSHRDPVTPVGLCSRRSHRVFQRQGTARREWFRADRRETKIRDEGRLEYAIAVCLHLHLAAAGRYIIKRLYALQGANGAGVYLSLRA